MNTQDLVTKIKDHLFVCERDDQKESPCPLSEGEYQERCQTIHNIGPTMNDVIDYCYEDGWGKDAVCALIFKVVFDEEWNFNLDWF